MSDLQHEVDALEATLLNFAGETNKTLGRLLQADTVQKAAFDAGFNSLTFKLSDSLNQIGEHQKQVITTQKLTFQNLGAELSGAQRESIASLNSTVSNLDSQRNFALNDLVEVTENASRELSRTLNQTMTDQMESQTDLFNRLLNSSNATNVGTLKKLEQDQSITQTLISVLSGDLIGGLTGVVGDFVPDLTVLAVDILGSVVGALTPDLTDIQKIMRMFFNSGSAVTQFLDPENPEPPPVRVART